LRLEGWQKFASAVAFAIVAHKIGVSRSLSIVSHRRSASAQVIQSARREKQVKLTRFRSFQAPGMTTSVKIARSRFWGCPLG
jgi:hypothetical protein